MFQLKMSIQQCIYSPLPVKNEFTIAGSTILLAPGAMLINCYDFQRSLLVRSISNLSVLATRGAYVFIFSLRCMLSVCNVFTNPRAGHQSRPLPLVLVKISII